MRNIFLKLLSILIKSGVVSLVVYLLTTITTPIAIDEHMDQDVSKVKLPDFYCSILPGYYDQQNCHLIPSIQKTIIIEWQKMGLDYNASRDLFQSLMNSNDPKVSSLKTTLLEGHFSQPYKGYNKDFFFEIEDKALAEKLEALMNAKRSIKWPKFIWWGKENNFHKIVMNFFSNQAEIGSRIWSAWTWTIGLSVISILLIIILSWFWLRLVLLQNRAQKFIQLILKFIYIVPIIAVAGLSVKYLTSERYGKWLDLFPAPGSFLLANDANVFLSMINIIGGLMLPAIILALPLSAAIAMRWESDIKGYIHHLFVLVLKSKGLAETNIYNKHLFKITLSPVIIQWGLAFISLLNGVLLIENIFAIPGVGRLLYVSIRQGEMDVLPVLIFTVSVATMTILSLTQYFSSKIDSRVSQDKWIG